jgi:hypothetical protein
MKCFKLFLKYIAYFGAMLATASLLLGGIVLSVYLMTVFWIDVIGLDRKTADPVSAICFIILLAIIGCGIKAYRDCRKDAD